MAKENQIKESTRVLGKKNHKPVRVPTNNAVPRIDFGNAIIEIKVGSRWRTYFGIGKVLRVKKSDDFDLVVVDFGRGSERPCKIYINSLNARKQVYTLKVGQYAQFGMIRTTDYALQKNDLYIAQWCMGIYVPKIVDIRNSELTSEEIEEMNNDDLSEGMTFLDLFEKND